MTGQPMYDASRASALLRWLAPAMLLACTATATAQAPAATAPKAAPAPAKAAAPAPASFGQQFQAARQLALSGQREEAIRAYTELLQRSPGNSDVLLGRGQVYSWMKRWPEAEADLRAATTASPQRADAWAALGNLYLWSDRPREAADAFGHWVELKPQDAEARIARGRAYRDAGDLRVARADFEAARALGADPAKVDTHLQSLMRRAQPEASVPAGFKWQAQLNGTWTDFSPSTRDSWTDYFVSLRRYFERGSLAAELLQAEHFGYVDRAWALDAYVDLWAHAYMNLRYQQNPEGPVIPEQAYRIELFQGVGNGWELSASYDRLEFRSTDVDLYGIGLGKYVGPFYLRARHLFTESTTSSGNSEQFLGRWYYAGNADDYAELRFGFGSGTQEVAGSPGVTTDKRSSSVSAAVVRYFTPHWGIKLGAGYGDENGGFANRSYQATLYRRW